MTQTGACRKTRPKAAATLMPGEARSQARTRRRGGGAMMASESIKRPQPPGQHEVEPDQDDGHYGECRGERQVTGRALLLVHHHADEKTRRADHAGDDV